MSEELQQIEDLKDKDDEVSRALKESLNAVIERYKVVSGKGDTTNVKL